MCSLLTKDFSDGLQWKEIKLVSYEGVGKVSRTKRFLPLLSHSGLNKWENSL